MGEHSSPRGYLGLGRSLLLCSGAGWRHALQEQGERQREKLCGVFVSSIAGPQRLRKSGLRDKGDASGYNLLRCDSYLRVSFAGFVKRLLVVFVLVLAAAVTYRSFGSAETARSEEHT